MNNNINLSGAFYETSNKPDKLFFLLHGYGDEGENFISLAKEIKNIKNKINFFAPNAPSIIPQYTKGRQWFDLNPNGINFNQAGPREKEVLKNDCLRSLKLIKKYIKSKCFKYDLSTKDCFILGFSQGAIMAFELGKFIDDIFAGCILLSGRILPANNHDSKKFLKTPLIIIHGDRDTVLEPKNFKESCQILKKQGFVFESHLIKDGEHNISSDIIVLIQNFLEKNL